MFNPNLTREDVRFNFWARLEVAGAMLAIAMMAGMIAPHVPLLIENAWLRIGVSTLAIVPLVLMDCGWRPRKLTEWRDRWLLDMTSPTRMLVALCSLWALPGLVAIVSMTLWLAVTIVGSRIPLIGFAVYRFVRAIVIYRRDLAYLDAMEAEK